MILVLRRAQAIIACIVLLLVLDCSAQQQADLSVSDQKDPDANSRILGVLPNFLTTDDNRPYEPLTAKKKLSLAVQESIDWPQFIFNGGLAYLYQLQRQNPSFGNGFAGYGKRYAAVTADQTIGNMLTDGICLSCTLFHDDPDISGAARAVFHRDWVLRSKQTVVARRDSGQCAFCDFLNGLEPEQERPFYFMNRFTYRDSRTASGNAEKFIVQVGGDTLNSVLEEFWPDVKRRFFTRSHS